MNLNKVNAGLGLLLLLFFLWRLALTVREADTVEDLYPTRAEAQADRLFERGWLPSILPDSSYDITTRNDLDTNTSKGSFSFDERDFPAFRAHLTETSTPSVYRYQGWVFTLDSSGKKVSYHTKHQSP